MIIRFGIAVYAYKYNITFHKIIIQLNIVSHVMLTLAQPET
jgi:hypothetical protein